MEIIHFKSEEEFVKNTQYYSEGFESKLYSYINNGSELLIKKYYDLNQVNLEKIKELSNIKTAGLLKPTYLVEIGDSIESFAMDFKKGFYPLSNQRNYLNDIQKYNLIMDVKQTILSLREENIIYADLNPGNVITNGEEVYLCDAINVKMEGFNFDEISSTMYKYIEKNGTNGTTGIDFYMLNLLTIYLFNDIKYDDIVESIELAVMNYFNKQPYEHIIGVTDSLEQLDMCCKIFLSSETCEDLLIDSMINNLGLSDMETIRTK